MKEKTNKYLNWNNKEIELNKDGFIKKWTDHVEGLHGLKSWRDIDGTKAMYDEIMGLVKELAGHTFDLKADDVHIYYGMDGVESHRIGKKYLIRNGKEVKDV
jgi:hypothetical protein